MTEHAIQVSCVNWFRRHYPDLLIMAIPNGGARSKKTGAMMKEEGVLAGVPDLFISVPSHGASGLWIEMKTSVGVVRASQKAVMKQLEAYGYVCKVCRSLPEFMNIVRTYLHGSEYKEQEDEFPMGNWGDYARANPERVRIQ